MKVAVVGAAGDIGQSLALLLKNHLPDGSDLSLYDIAPVTPGIAADLSHIPTPVSVKGYAGEDPTPALDGADVALITAGVTRKPGMDSSALFQINAGIIKSLFEKIAVVCPRACVVIITNPVNTMVPIAAEVLKKAGMYDKRKLFGVTTLDVIRSEAFVAESKDKIPSEVRVPVIGGHSGSTIVPLFSQVKGVSFTREEVEKLTVRVQNADAEVVEAKAGGGSATLSTAQAACRFTLSLIKALIGEEVSVECAYIDGNSDHAPFFAQPVKLGKDGVEEVPSYGVLSDYEKSALDNMLETLNADIETGIDYAG